MLPAKTRTEAGKGRTTAELVSRGPPHYQSLMQSRGYPTPHYARAQNQNMEDDQEEDYESLDAASGDRSRAPLPGYEYKSLLLPTRIRRSETHPWGHR